MSSGRSHHLTEGEPRHDDCLVFMHIPKTAGSTLSTSLSLNYQPLRSIHLDFMNRPADEIEKLIPYEERAGVRLLRGHLPYGVHRCIPRPCSYITVLREPVARVISAYNFILRNPAAFSDHPLHDPEIGGKIGLDGYLESEEHWIERGNRQTRLLSDRHAGELNRDALEEAKQNLATFLVVGLTERFEETFVLVRRALRLRVPLYVTRLVAPRPEVSDRVVDLIRDQNRLDLELYEFGRELFSRQIAAQDRTFGIEAAMFRRMRSLFRAAGRGRTEELLVKLSRMRERVSPGGAMGER